MKYLVRLFILLVAMGAMFPAHAFQDNEKSAQAKIENIDAIQAMRMANQWKWSKKQIKSFVTPQEVVFEFSDGTAKRIPLPEEKMVIAVAPYIRRTHK